MLKAKLTKGGKIAIPALYRKQLNLQDGEELIFEVCEQKLVLTSLHNVLNDIRKRIAQYHPDNTSLVDQLIAERRSEAEHD